MEVSLMPLKRFDVVDALRGFAIMTILLLHSLEHFDVYWFPEWEPQWLKTIDGHFWDTLFFMFSGKAYSIFALLFGLTFYIQYSKRASLGGDFSGRFAWRMFWLLIFGMFNTLFYCGDILVLYAIVGLIMIPMRKAGNNVLLIVAGGLLLQPYEIGRVIYSLLNPDYVPADPYCYTLFSLASEGQRGESLWGNMWANLQYGRVASLLWCWDHGRVFHTAALFMLGYWLGRRKMFAETPDTYRFWKIALVISFVLSVFLYTTKWTIACPNAVLQNLMINLIDMWASIALTTVWVSLFCLLYAKYKGKVLNWFKPLGKMSLSNYILQSIVGALIFNGFGLAMYQYTGAVLSFCIGVVMLIANWCFCRWWISNHKYGPFEGIWHKITWIELKK